MTGTGITESAHNNNSIIRLRDLQRINHAVLDPFIAIEHNHGKQRLVQQKTTLLLTFLQGHDRKRRTLLPASQSPHPER